nr:ATPase, T2SS/T4P/T4SS family [Cellulomonas fulva]
MDGVAILEHEVRELIRRRGIDPVRDRPSITALVEAAIADYDARSVVGAVPPLVDGQAAHKAVLDAVAGFGPLQRYLDDPEIEEIWINNPQQVFVARRGEAELTTTILTAVEVRELVERMLKVSGRRLDLSSPFVDATLPGGERLHAVIPDVTRQHWSVNIRKYVVRADHLDDLVVLGSLPHDAAAFLAAAVRAGLNILVSGATQGGSLQALYTVRLRSHEHERRAPSRHLRPHLRCPGGVGLHRTPGRGGGTVRRCARLAGSRHLP